MVYMSVLTIKIFTRATEARAERLKEIKLNFFSQLLVDILYYIM